MKLLIDAGATSCKCAYIEPSGVKYFQVSGVNTYLQDADSFSAIFASMPLEAENVAEVFYYGAGCGTSSLQLLVKKTLQQLFPSSTVSVASDLLGACRATGDTAPCLVAILGTGMNTCFYDGQKIQSNIPPLGYVLGDEGSGAHMGKQLLSDLFKYAVPKEFEKLILQQAGSLEQILNKVYKQESPSRFLASFCPLIKEHLELNYCYRLVQSSFEAFFDKHILNYCQSHTLHVVGSVAYHFRDLLQATAQEYGISLISVVKQPLEGLVAFHADKELGIRL